MTTKFSAVANGTIAAVDLGVGAKCNHVTAQWERDADVTAATVTLQGSTDNITFVPLIAWTNGLQGAGTWANPTGPAYRYFNVVIANFAHSGSGAVRANIDTYYGTSSSSAHGGVGAY
jgi:hypothetical protein